MDARQTTPTGRTNWEVVQDKHEFSQHLAGNAGKVEVLILERANRPYIVESHAALVQVVSQCLSVGDEELLIHQSGVVHRRGNELVDKEAIQRVVLPEVRVRVVEYRRATQNVVKMENVGEFLNQHFDLRAT